MPDMSPLEILKIDKSTYETHFRDGEFGMQLAAEIAQSLLMAETLQRKTEGSSLVFAIGEDAYLKITPPFFEDSMEAEIQATKIIGDRLPFPIPKIVAEGLLEGWHYIVTRRVPGTQAKDVFRKLSAENLRVFASDIGHVIQAFQNLNVTGFERSFGPWHRHLAERRRNQEAIHRGRGNSEEWVGKICGFLDEHAEMLNSLESVKMIHADLNHEHLMLNEVDGLWRISGVLDLADAMNAPVEMEFILPMLCFFRGNAELQQHLMKEAGCTPRFRGQDYSNLMMTLALQNRFMAFHDWFDRELKNGATSVAEVARVVFPSV
jgi:hygromycin-B 7''-O-kinase